MTPKNLLLAIAAAALVAVGTWMILSRQGTPLPPPPAVTAPASPHQQLAAAYPALKSPVPDAALRVAWTRVQAETGAGTMRAAGWRTTAEGNAAQVVILWSDTSAGESRSTIVALSKQGTGWTVSALA